MSMSQSVQLQTPALPNDLVSAETKLVYLYLATRNGATVEDLHESLGMKKLALYPVLGSLLERNLIDRDGQTFLPMAA